MSKSNMPPEITISRHGYGAFLQVEPAGGRESLDLFFPAEKYATSRMRLWDTFLHSREYAVAYLGYWEGRTFSIGRDGTACGMCLLCRRKFDDPISAAQHVSDCIAQACEAVQT